MGAAPQFEETLPDPDDNQLQTQDENSDNLGTEGAEDQEELSNEDRLKLELEDAKRQASALQSERDYLAKEKDKLNYNWHDLVNKQGVELGKLRKQAEFNGQPGNQNSSQKRINITKQVDPILQTDKFQQAWVELADVVEAQNRELEELKSKSNSQVINEEILKLREDIRTLAINTYRSEEEDDLKRKYRFNENDMSEVRSVMERTGIASPKAAAMLVERLEDKIANSRANSRNDNNNRGPGRPRKEDNGYKGDTGRNIGKEMIDTGSLSRSAPNRQNHKKDTSANMNFTQEIMTAIENNEFDLWPVDKQNQAREYLAKQAAAKTGGVAGRFMQ